MDSYGQTQPLDFASMENVFMSLCNDSHVPVSGSHWSSLINAYGCIGGDIERAIAVFESVANHPSSLRNPRSMPDAVVYEALINVFVTQHRMDLAEPYIQRLQADGIHMTAYIANLLIKGHAATGGIEQARAVFESLHDPPDGIAAPNNHVPHGAAEVVASQPSASAPVYREVCGVQLHFAVPRSDYSSSHLLGKPWFAPSLALAMLAESMVFFSAWKQGAFQAEWHLGEADL